MSQGVVDSPVYITSIHDDSVGGDTNSNGNATSPAPADWNTIEIPGGDGEATFNYTLFRYGGISTGDGMIKSTGGSLSIDNSTISHSGQHGIAFYGGSLNLTHSTISHNAQAGLFVRAALDTISFTDNHFADNGGDAVAFEYPSAQTTAPIISGNTASNNLYNGISLAGEIGTLTLPNQVGLPYIITDSWSYYNTPIVTTGSTLTFTPGTVVKFIDNSRLRVGGNLIAVGTSENPIVFTSIHDDSVGGDTNGNGNATSPAPGDWNNIDIPGGDGEATFNYTLFRYGGISTGDGMIKSADGSLSIDNSTISHSNQHGIAIYGGSLYLTQSTISHNAQAGLFINQGSVIIQNNGIYENDEYGVYNADLTTIVDASNNWWGSASGPAPYGTGNGINYLECYNNDTGIYDICQYYVDVIPWQN